MMPKVPEARYLFAFINKVTRIIKWLKKKKKGGGMLNVVNLAFYCLNLLCNSIAVYL